jgi:anthranilate phosphoribosyltransferase
MGERTWSQLLGALLRGVPLSTADTGWAMSEIMSGSATPAQIAGFAIALRAKGETPEEIAGLVDVMLANAERVGLPEQVRTAAVDIVGTGGDQAHTVNISTMAAIIVAAGGVKVVKHGGRAASSLCGTADLIETFGVPLDLGPTEIERCVLEAGIGFCFAPRFHPGMRHAGATRRDLGVPTFFNILGPLANPARPPAATVGCADLRLAPVMAEVFARRGDCVLLVRGEDGLDEITTTAATRIWVASLGRVREEIFDVADLGIARSVAGDLRGGDAAFNAGVARRVLAGETGPVRDAVLVNAAAAFAAHEGATHGGIGPDLGAALDAGLRRARTAIDSGAAENLLTRWVKVASSMR